MTAPYLSFIDTKQVLPKMAGQQSNELGAFTEKKALANRFSQQVCHSLCLSECSFLCPYAPLSGLVRCLPAGVWLEAQKLNYKHSTHLMVISSCQPGWNKFWIACGPGQKCQATILVASANIATIHGLQGT